MRIKDIIRIAEDYMHLGISTILFLLFLYIIGYSLIYRKLLKGTKKISKLKFCITAVFICYIIVVLGATMLSRLGSMYGDSINLHFLSSNKEAWNDFSVIEWRNLILNILLFVPMGILQAPLLMTVIAFTSIFTCYHLQKYGNLKITYASKENMEDITVSSDINFDKKKTRQPIYKVPIATKSETKQLADQVFKQFGSKVDSSMNDEYDDYLPFQSKR